MGDDFIRTLAGVSGLLGLKSAVTLALQVRTKLLTHEYNIEEDKKVSESFMRPLLVVGFGAVGPPLELMRLRGIVSNSLETEPAFLFMGLMMHLAGVAHKADVRLLKLYVLMRYIHAVAYQLGLQPVRGIAWTIGFSLNLCFGAQLVKTLL